MAKWEGKVITTLTKASANEIWPLFIDFFNFHKWFPNLSTCYGVHGLNGEVGATRYWSPVSRSQKKMVAIVPTGAKGCVVEWSFVVDPVEGLTYEFLVQKYQNGLDQATKKMEDALVLKQDL
ncbi:lachrymatory-factor synthase [Tanacetum coccineum]